MIEKEDLVKLEGLIKYKWLDYKLKSPTDTVTFELEDGAIVKAKVDIVRAGIASEVKNPDGTSLYNVNIDVKLNITPANKTFYAPKSPTIPTSDKQHPTVV